ncbi:MAG TPA: hypothetical protein VJO52_07565 [Gemmatimonadaceae bacterium]|nr:hypothetical protein [Gemmatimonadaceae bacterium]
MTNSIAARIDQPNVPAALGTGTFVAACFVAWLAVILLLGANGAFVPAPGAPPLALLIALLAPLGVFAVGYRSSRSLRAFVRSADLRVIAGLQGWRWAGFGFLALATYRVLPAIFAWPAGLGDMTIGVTAPLVLTSLLRRPDFAASKRFVAWNLGGILDLTVAVTIGAVGPLVVPSFYSAVSTAPMSRLPLVLIPTYLVPAFLMLHFTALIQARRLKKEATR